MTSSNGFTQKEMLQMVLEKLEEVDNKLENKLDKTEFYTVLGLLVAIGGVVAAIECNAASFIRSYITATFAFICK